MTWHAVASLAEAELAAPWLSARVGGVDVALARLDGSWYAVGGHCTHAGCAFVEDADVEGDAIVCNCHGSEFDLRTGAVLRGPAEDPVATFRVRVGAAAIEVDVDVEAAP